MTKKRGMKPRSQRNRKRPRSQIRSNDDLIVSAQIRPLLFDGKPIPGAPHFLRILEPYPYSFTSFAKERWLGRTILDVYAKEFGSYPESYYESAIRQGRILVSDEKVEPSYCIKGNDILMHTVHRHEPAVALASDQAPFVTIVGETDTLLAVDKPSTLPVHPCGGYHQNSLMHLLEGKYGKLYTIHRLDRLTTGLVILSKNSEEARLWGTAIQERDHCEKIYLARVQGNFPCRCPDRIPRLSGTVPEYGEWVSEQAAEEVSATSLRKRNAHGYWATRTSKPGSAVMDNVSLQDLSNDSNRAIDETRWLEAALHENPANEGEDAIRGPTWLHVACPVRIAEPKNGVCKSDTFDDLDDETYVKTVKSAQTSFAAMHYDEASDSTIVLCRPMTGRTHQIRIHLEYLGHSIANDPSYGGDPWYANTLGKEACTKAQAELANFDKAHRKAHREGMPSTDSSTECHESLVTTDVPATAREIEQLKSIARDDEESLDQFIKRTCVWCARSQGKVMERSELEFMVRSPGIWLHALQYRVAPDGKNFVSFRTDFPPWSKPSGFVQASVPAHSQLST